MAGRSVGVVGLGLGRHFTRACAASEYVDRLVICDPDGSLRANVVDEISSVAASYSSLSEMLDAERLDAAVVVTPDHLHRPHALACFAAGCNVLMTKPIATNLDDGRAIVRAAEAGSRVLMVAHERRFRTRVRAIKKMLDSGDLGDIVHLRIDTIQDKRGQFSISPWYASAEAGRTALVGSGIHEVDLARHLFDRPLDSVFAYSNRLGNLEFPRDKTTSALFRFAGGGIAQVTVTYEAHWPEGGSIDDHFRLVGTRGIVVGDRVARDGQTGWSDLPRDTDEIRVSIRRCVDEFLDALATGGPVPVDGREAFRSLAAAVAADEAAAAGSPRAPEEL